MSDCLPVCLQQEARLERQEDRLHQKAVNAALHGNLGKAVALEVIIASQLLVLDLFCALCDERVSSHNNSHAKQVQD